MLERPIRQRAKLSSISSSLRIGLTVVVAAALPACGGGDDEAARTATWCELTLDLANERTEAERRGEDGGLGPRADPDLQAAEERVREHGWPAGLRDAGAVIERGLPLPHEDGWEAHAEALEDVEDFARAECNYDPIMEEFLFGGGDRPTDGLPMRPLVIAGKWRLAAESGTRLIDIDVDQTLPSGELERQSLTPIPFRWMRRMVAGTWIAG